MAASDEAVSGWSCTQVAQWLKGEGFGEYVDLLCTQHRLDGLSLLALTEADLRGPPLGLTVLGDIKRLTVALRRLQRRNQSQLEELGLKLSSIPAGSSMHPVGGEWDFEEAAGRFNGGGGFCSGGVLRQRRGERCESGSGETLCRSHFNGRCRQHLAGRLDPEVWKTVLSSIYVFLVIGFTSFVMVLVHERVPDMRTYPPLPDIFLDRYCTQYEHVEQPGVVHMCILLSLLSNLYTHRCFDSPTVFPEFPGPLQWLKPAALSCATCFYWSCSCTNIGRRSFQLSPSWRQRSGLTETDCACAAGPFCSGDCVLWWEPCSCSVVAQCSSPPSPCLVNTWSVPVRWETHENRCGVDLVLSEKLLLPPLFSVALMASFFFFVCRLMTTPSLRYRGHSPSGVDLGWHWQGSKHVETTCSVGTRLLSQCSTSLWPNVSFDTFVCL